MNTGKLLQPVNYRDDVLEPPAVLHLATQIEHIVERFQSDIIPKLRETRSKKLLSCADKLQAHITAFDANCVIPYNTSDMSLAEIKKAFDTPMMAVAAMHRLLNWYIDEHCSFKEHSGLLLDIKKTTDEFYNDSYSEREKWNLKYYELDQLLITLERQLGLDLEIPNGKPADRSTRNKSKDANKIESALLDFLGAVIPLRKEIISPKKQMIFDTLVIDAFAKLVDSPRYPAPHSLDKLFDYVSDELRKKQGGRAQSAEPEDKSERAERINALRAATAILVRIGKWIRKVDLCERVPNKRKIIEHKLDLLTSLARGEVIEAMR